MANPSPYSVQSAKLTSLHRADRTIDDLSTREFIEVINNDLLAHLKNEVEEAKLRCEDEEDDTSLGEYMALKAAVERIEEFLDEAPKKYYSVPLKQDFGGYDYRSTMYAQQAAYRIQSPSQFKLSDLNP